MLELSHVTVTLILFLADKEWGTQTRQVMWTNQQPTRGRTSQNDLRTKDRSISAEAQQAEKPIEFWHILFTEEMLDVIVLHTNEKIQGEIDERRAETGSYEFLKKNSHLKLIDKVKYYFYPLSVCFTFLKISVADP